MLAISSHLNRRVVQSCTISKAQMLFPWIARLYIYNIKLYILNLVYTPIKQWDSYRLCRESEQRFQSKLCKILYLHIRVIGFIFNYNVYFTRIDSNNTKRLHANTVCC